MKKSGHNLSHYRLTTLDLGQLVPVGLVEVLPGDTFRHSTNIFARLSPLAAPVMHQVDVRCHHFFVPHRIVWEAAGGTGTFEDFITGGNDGADAQSVPTIATTGSALDLLDYYGVPTVAGINVSALPIAGYNAIFNEWYRDQDLMTVRDPDDLTVANIAWGKDYLSAMRPFAQRGEALSLPLGTEAPITAHGVGDTTAGGGTLSRDAEPDAQVYFTRGGDTVPMVTDLSGATAATVGDLRLAFALQRFRELRAQLGARYPEYLRTYGVRNPDGRIQLPEYLAGGSAPVQFSEVLQTTPTAAGRDFSVGDLYGHGVSALRGNNYVRTFPEWGYVHTFVSIRPRAMYVDGIARTWLQQDREDFFVRELQGIGEQPVYKNEVYADAVDGDDTFGYTGRYDQYRSLLSGVSAEFRDTLDYWHLGRIFASDPALNETWVTCEPSKRVFNEQTQNSVWMMARHRIGASRAVAPRAFTRTL